MNATEQYIATLANLKQGDLALLRSHARQGLDNTVSGFDLFAGLWWPLRQNNPQTPRREPSWLVAKLYGAFPLQHIREDAASLPSVLGCCAPRDNNNPFRQRFDTLLQTPLSELEPHLRWALAVAADLVQHKKASGIDWAQLLDDLSIWDRGAEHRRRIDIREEWACQYLKAAK